MLLRFGLLLIAAHLAPAYAAPAAPVQAWTVDSLIKIFPDDRPGTGRMPSPAVLVPRNGHGSIQIALRSAAAVTGVAVELTSAPGVETEIRRAGYVPVGSNPPGTPYDEVLRQAPALFPDPLLVGFPFDLQPDRTESIWITLYAPASSSPGDRKLTARITAGGKPLATVPFTVRVADAVVPEKRTLHVTNWFNVGRPFMSRYFKSAADEEGYWQLLANIGRVMAAHGQTMMLAPVFELTRPVVKEGRIEFDFSRFDRWVETFDKAGMTTIEGGHLLGRATEYYSPIVVPSYVVENGAAVARSLDPFDPRAGESMAAFTSALYAHLKQRGWAGRYIQHVHDEPHDQEKPVYERFARLVKTNMPGIPILDAVSLEPDMSYFVADIWVPVLGTFDHQLEKIAAHRAAGGQAWYYTCIFPQGRYLNRFIDLPAIKTRLLHWLNYRHGFTGFLHWGGNYWGPEPFNNVQAVINDNTTLLPAGDNAIVYPDPERNTVLSSIRLEHMREGIEEYELLAELGRKDPGKARSLAARAIPNMNDYVRDVPAFRALQAELLGERPVSPPRQAPGRPGAAPPAPASAARTAASPARQASATQAWFVDSLIKLFPDDPAFKSRLSQPVFHAARRAHVSIQLALRTEGLSLGDLYVDAPALTGPGVPIDTITVRRVDYVVVTTNTKDTPSAELLRPAPALFPDVLCTEFPMTLESGRTRAAWITVNVPEDQKPGEYAGALRVRQGATLLQELPYKLIVHNAAVPEKIPLAVTNHFNFSDNLIARTYGVTRYSDAWWRLVSNFARFIGSYHQNSIAASPVLLAQPRLENGKLVYDFSNFERFVDTFRSAGVDRYIEGGDLLFRERRRGAPIMMRAWVVEDGKPALRMIPYADPRAAEFLSGYLPALGALLERRGWSNSWLQGILDEPHQGEHEAFAEIAARVRRLLPGVRIIEPVGAKQDLSFMKDVDILTLQLGTFDDARLQELQKSGVPGRELWLYTALEPTGDYPNRFIDYSLTKVRILHWMNYRFGFPGWLHWGGNYWGPEPAKDTQPVINEGRTYLPPGDAYITYPDRVHRGLYSSIRLEQMREGIEDYALLGQLAKRDRAAASALANEAVRTFRDYIRTPEQFRAVQLKLLQAASQ